MNPALTAVHSDFTKRRAVHGMLYAPAGRLGCAADLL